MRRAKIIGCGSRQKDFSNTLRNPVQKRQCLRHRLQSEFRLKIVVQVILISFKTVAERDLCQQQTSETRTETTNRRSDRSRNKSTSAEELRRESVCVHSLSQFTAKGHFGRDKRGAVQFRHCRARLRWHQHRRHFEEFGRRF